MPRSQNAHAIVNAGFLFRFNKKSTDLEYISIVYGGISPTFIRASKTEDILAGRDPFTDESLQIALKSLSSEINPTEAPPDPSAAYRKMLALALYYKVQWKEFSNKGVIITKVYEFKCNTNTNRIMFTYSFDYKSGK